MTITPFSIRPPWSGLVRFGIVKLGLGAAMMLGVSSTAFAQSQWTGTWESYGKTIELIQSGDFVYGEIDNASFLQGHVSADGKTLRGYVEAADIRQDGYFEFTKGDPSRRIGSKVAQDPLNFTGDVWTTQNYTALKRWPVGIRPGDSGTYAKFQSEARPIIQSLSTRRPDPERPAGRPTLDKFLVTIRDSEGRAWVDYETTSTMTANNQAFKRRMEENRVEIAEQRKMRSETRRALKQQKQVRRDRINTELRVKTDPRRHYDANLSGLPASTYGTNFKPVTMKVFLNQITKESTLDSVVTLFSEGDAEVFGTVDVSAICEWSNGNVKTKMTPINGSSKRIFNVSRDNAIVPPYVRMLGSTENVPTSPVEFAIRECYDKPSARIKLEVGYNFTERDLFESTDDSTGDVGFSFYLETLPHTKGKEESSALNGRLEIKGRFDTDDFEKDPNWHIHYDPEDDVENLSPIIYVSLAN